MASSMSKRNQARNEQALQDLIRSTPGNDRCADCQARNPGWASWSLGIFLCMRCAALHRKLGVHISKVKSLSMDQWTNEQVENMRNTGNTKSNEKWNPQRKKAPIPLDADEVDSAMERFIRQKYEKQEFVHESIRPAARSSTAPTRQRMERPVSIDDTPPTPPPKPGRKVGFGLRSVSSTSFLSRFGKDDKKKLSNAHHAAPIGLNKESRVFGATIGVTESDKGLEMKLIQLKEMGFPDIRRNTTVLRGNGGDLERTIESLVRLGEGSQTQSTRSSTMPVTISEDSSSKSEFAPSNGASIVRSPISQQFSSPADTPPTARSTNPWETKQQSATSAFDAAMANLTISQPPAQSNLFPNSTGGPTQHSIQQQPQIQQYTNNPYAQQQPYVQMPTNNPFLMTQPISAQPTTNPYLTQTIAYPNSFTQQADSLSSPQYSTFSPQQSMFSPQQQDFVQSPQSGQPLMADFQNQQLQIPAFMPQSGQAMPAFGNQLQSPSFMPQSPAGYYNPYQQMQPIAAQPIGRLDKNSILALYNTPMQAPVQSPQDQAVPSLDSSSQLTQGPGLASPRRSATMPIVGSKNPFAQTGNANTAYQP